MFSKSSMLLNGEFCHNYNNFTLNYPGTTWVQEIVYLITTDLDFHSARASNIEDRFPYLEFIYPGIREISKKEGGRLIKSHLPLCLMPPGVRQGKAKVGNIFPTCILSREKNQVNFSAVKFFHLFNLQSFITYFLKLSPNKSKKKKESGNLGTCLQILFCTSPDIVHHNYAKIVKEFSITALCLCCRYCT